jgi:hypothetical protein
MKKSIAILLFFVSFGVYLKTLCPTITFADSGELITASYLLAIPHSPGSPLYCLLGKLFTLLPLGSVAYRVNLMSAFFASLSVVLVYLIVLLIQRQTSSTKDYPLSFSSHIAPVVGSLCLAFSKSFWSYALVAEIYAFKAFFLLLLVFILFKWFHAHHRQPIASRYYLYLFALIYGLSLSNHISMILFLPAFGYFILMIDRRLLFDFKKVILLLLFFFVGLALYLYLPIRSLANPALDWGNPENLQNFIWLVTGRQYQHRLFTLPASQLLRQLRTYLINLKIEFTWLPIFLGIFGLGSLFRKRGLFFFLLFIYLIDLVFNLGQAAPPAPVHFFLSSFLIFSLWIGYGLSSILVYVKKSTVSYLLPVFLLLPLISWQIHYDKVDQSNNYAAYDWAGNVLGVVEEKGIIVDQLPFPFWYLQYVEKRRPDVTTIASSLFSHPFPWYLEKVQAEHPELDIVSPVQKAENYVRYADYIYPVDLQTITGLIRGYQGSPTMRLAWLLSTVITGYVVEHNIGQVPIYTTLTNPEIREGCYLISRGPIYRIRNQRPQLTVTDPRIQYKSPVDFSGDLYLLGYDLSSRIIRPGGLLYLTYYWTKIKKSSLNKFKVLLIFTDACGRFSLEKGLPKFYECHLLAHGFPLDYESDQIIRESYFSLVPSELPAGTYYLWLIVQDLEEGRLLEPEESGLLRQEGFVRIGSLEVVGK